MPNPEDTLPLPKPRGDAFPVARDVAELAGVSESTVSRVFNGTAGVRADKRAAVMTAAQTLGFVANGAARALSMRRYMAVGAVVPNIENDVFVRTLSTFQERLRRAGYMLLTTNAGYALEDELREATFLIEHGIDGLMLVGDIHRPELLDRIDRLRIPMIQTYTLSKDRPCVGFDNARAAARAATYFMDLGHTRFGVITGTRQDNDRSFMRVTGIEHALAARGLCTSTRRTTSKSPTASAPGATRCARSAPPARHRPPRSSAAPTNSHSAC